MPFSRSSKEDLKEKLATAYRIIAHLGMDDLTYTHLSARLPDDAGFLIAPFGFLFEEVGPQDLLEVSYAGVVLNSEAHTFNPTALTIHGVLYQARPDLRAVFHLHTPASIAVSVMSQGLRPLSQHALHFYDRIAYHPYDSLAQHEEIGHAMAQDLGALNVMLLRSHGSLTAGKTIEEAFFYAYHLERACQVQVMTHGAPDQILEPSAEVAAHTRDALLAFEANLGTRDFIALARKVKI